MLIKSTLVFSKNKAEAIIEAGNSVATWEALKSLVEQWGADDVLWAEIKGTVAQAKLKPPADYPEGVEMVSRIVAGDEFTIVSFMSESKELVDDLGEKYLKMGNVVKDKTNVINGKYTSVMIVK